ncbi:sorting nexin [Anaeramoeba ignava]|uniref:Sorting nexin n=1 Tax=Anaeramoeba ignava TaxID=1746090 RepID=A0A9Q0LTH7_ANAIG|nr:sorting nexin [Anaeramoeba ignava]
MDEIYANVLYEYSPQAKDELPLRVGEVIRVVSQDPSGWWEGESNGLVGLFPSTYVMIISNDINNENQDPQELNITNEQEVTKESNEQIKEDHLDPNINANQDLQIEINQKIDHVLEKKYLIENSCWKETPIEANVDIGESTKILKYKGMKKFIVYEIKFKNYCVQRRYKHFLWLRDHLHEYYTDILIPPLPEKQISGRFHEEFIGKRKKGLQFFLQKIMEHPVLRTSWILEHFLSSENAKDWKNGKKMIQNQLKSHKTFLECVEISQINPEKIYHNFVENHNFKEEIQLTQQNMKNLHTNTVELFIQKLSDLSKSYSQLGTAFVALSENEGHGLSWKIEDYLSQNIEKISKLIGETFTKASPFLVSSYSKINGILEIIAGYQRFYSSIQDNIKITDSIIRHYKFPQQKKHSTKRDNSDTHELNHDEQREIFQSDMFMNKDLIVCDSELEQFHHNRLIDFSKILEEFLKIQLEFHEKMTEFWENTLLAINQNIIN